MNSDRTRLERLRAEWDEQVGPMGGAYASYTRWLEGRVVMAQEALEEARSALLDVTRTKRSDAWGVAQMRAEEALAVVEGTLER